MGLDELFAALKNTRTIQDHPDWPQFKARKFPRAISFYYTNKQGQEAYWDQARIIKLDLRNLILVVEGTHGDPLKFEIARIQHCKDAQTGERVQDLLFDLVRMWRDIYAPAPETEPE